MKGKPGSKEVFDRVGCKDGDETAAKQADKGDDPERGAVGTGSAPSLRVACHNRVTQQRDATLEPHVFEGAFSVS